MLTSFDELTAGFRVSCNGKNCYNHLFTRNVKFNLLKWMNSGDFWKITLRGQHIALQRGHETTFQTIIWVYRQTRTIREGSRY